MFADVDIDEAAAYGRAVYVQTGTPVEERNGGDGTSDVTLPVQQGMSAARSAAVGTDCA
ncbi:hypothetical protein [Streptomyces zhihengii]